MSLNCTKGKDGKNYYFLEGKRVSQGYLQANGLSADCKSKRKKPVAARSRKRCPSDKVLNERTNRCVKRSGKIGRTITQRSPSRTRGRVDIKPKSKSPIKSASGKTPLYVLASKPKSPSKDTYVPLMIEYPVKQKRRSPSPYEESSHIPFGYDSPIKSKPRSPFVPDIIPKYRIAYPTDQQEREGEFVPIYESEEGMDYGIWKGKILEEWGAVVPTGLIDNVRESDVWKGKEVKNLYKKYDNKLWPGDFLMIAPAINQVPITTWVTYRNYIDTVEDRAKFMRDVFPTYYLRVIEPPPEMERKLALYNSLL